MASADEKKAREKLTRNYHGAGPGVNLHDLDMIFDENEEILYDVYLMDISYFSGKLETYFRYKRLNFHRREQTYEEMYRLNYKNTGLLQVPIVYDRRNKVFLRDTSSIIDLIEKNQSDVDGGRNVLPDCKVQRFLSYLVEDYADEWMWTPALYYRWNFRLDAGNLARRFTMHDFVRNSVYNVPKQLLQIYIIDRQYFEYVKSAGVRDDATKQHTESIYLRTLDHMEKILSKTPFLLGDRPTLVDFGFMASMFRHFSLDPTPSKVMRLRAPAVFEWVARMWNSSKLGPAENGGVTCARETVPQTWDPILRDIGNQYIPYLVENAKAVDANQMSFDFAVPDGSNVVYKAMKPKSFHAWCGKRLIDHWDELNKQEQDQVLEMCKEFEILLKNRELFVRAAKQWNLASEVEPPYCPTKTPPKSEFQALFFGTPNHEQKLPQPTNFFISIVVLQVLAIMGAIRARGNLFAQGSMSRSVALVLLGTVLGARLQNSFM